MADILDIDAARRDVGRDQYAGLARRNRSRARCRAPWDLLPCIASAVTPPFSSPAATRLARCLVRAKTRTRESAGSSRISASRRCLSPDETWKTPWRTRSTGVACGVTATRAGVAKEVARQTRHIARHGGGKQQ